MIGVRDYDICNWPPSPPEPGATKVRKMYAQVGLKQMFVILSFFAPPWDRKLEILVSAAHKCPQFPDTYVRNGFSMEIAFGWLLDRTKFTTRNLSQTLQIHF